MQMGASTPKIQSHLWSDQAPRVDLLISHYVQNPSMSVNRDVSTADKGADSMTRPSAASPAAISSKFGHASIRPHRTEMKNLSQCANGDDINLKLPELKCPFCFH